MISTQQRNILRVLCFQGEKQDDRFNSVVSSVTVVTQENVFFVRTVSNALKNLQKIVELSVEITTHLNN